MKQIRLFTKSILVLGISIVLGACSSNDFLESENNSDAKDSARHTMKMEFIGNVVGYDQQNQPQTRTSGSEWSDGDKIYITFYNGSNIIPGEATYSSSSGWSVSYDGDLAIGSNLKCEARYFVNATFTSSSLVSLNSNTEIYEDLNGKYSYSDGSLVVAATLSPKTGRLRFAGTSGEKIYVYPTGVSSYTKFSIGTNTMFSTSSCALITLTVMDDGYTPYIYGYFTDSNWSLGLIGSDCAFTRTCTADMLKAGNSGYMAIPSETSYANWRNGFYVKASGVEFKMVPVAGCDGGLFLMAETETTEALYKSVNGTASTSQLPISYVSYSEITSFIKTLNNETNLNFSLPSAERWMYAAKGGNKTQGYTYAGSNTIGDVAWYSDNCSSKQTVKTKAPNELGLYDMSGNVAETTLYSSYYQYYGGNYSSAASACTSTSKTSSSNSGGSLTAGFRLILTCE